VSSKGAIEIQEEKIRKGRGKSKNKDPRGKTPLDAAVTSLTSMQF